MQELTTQMGNRVTPSAATARRLTLAYLRGAFCVCALVGVVYVHLLATQRHPTPLVFDSPTSLLIIAAHSDDDVISAGGLGIRNSALGGLTTVAIVTQEGPPSYADTRNRETQAAWKIVDKGIAVVACLGFASRQEWNAHQRAMLRDSLQQLVRRVQPRLVVIPLAEGGNIEHDMLNQEAHAVLDSMPGLEVLQAAEYNPYFIAHRTPGKTLWLLVRLLPVVPFKDPNYGLDPGSQQRLVLSDQEQHTKNRMLLSFISQRSVIPLRQFGYPDLFDATRHLPRADLRVGAKSLSWLSVLAIVAAFFLVHSIGTFVGLRRPHLTIVLLATIGVLAVIACAVSGTRVVMEDLLYLLFLGAGLSMGWLVARYGR